MTSPAGHHVGSSRSSLSSGSESATLPKVGGVRCYWALMRPIYAQPEKVGSKMELVFVYPDPVLGSHLAKQKMSMMGRSLLEFIHPHEREQARRDLTSAISTDDLQGSVTRVRFARLSKVKIILGCPVDEVEMPKNWEKVVEDDEYLVLDLVLNWVADGLLLAFFHAIRDMDPVANNDPNRRDEGWSNFCGTANMDDEQIEMLTNSVTANIPLSPPTRYPPTRVFQLHTTPHSPNHPSSLLFSWPPSRQPQNLPQPSPRFDGLYDPDEYTTLMQGVNMDPNTLPHNPNEVRTTCTTRFGAKHSITSEGVYRLVTSVFIPYGTLIFSCFQTEKVFELPSKQNSSNGTGAGMNNGAIGMNGMNPTHDGSLAPTNGYSAIPGPSHTNFTTGPPANQLIPPISTTWEQSQPIMDTAYLTPTSAHMSISGSAGMEGNASASSSASGYHRFQAQSSYGNSPSPFSTSPAQINTQVSNWGSGVERQHSNDTPSSASYPYHPQQGQHPQNPYPPPYNPPQHQQPPPNISSHHPGYQEFPNNQNNQYPSAPSSNSNMHTSNSYSSSSSHTTSPQDPKMQLPAYHNVPYPNGMTGPTPSKLHSQASMATAGGNSSTRPLVRPPGDVECCIHCGTRESPEWRRSENGVKDLCNACGLKLARQVAKRDGKQKPRKKKDK